MVKNIIAVIAGIIVGGIINMGIILISDSIIPLPEGLNPADPKNFKESIHLFEFRHFIFPFLAHAIGTFAGAYLTSRLAASIHFKLALLIGAFFLLGGVINVVQLGAPLWFEVFDIVFAYIPMAWLGWKIAR